MLLTEPCALSFSSAQTLSDDPRWGHRAHFLEKGLKDPSSAPKSDWFILGYPDDEGISINKGRPGAALGPDQIRQIFYKTTVTEKTPSITDLGNLHLEGPLAERHERAKKIIQDLSSNKTRWITLGGGHDYGYPDGASFLAQHRGQKCVVINFDAHLDVRPPTNGLSSGTPFFRLKEEFPEMQLVEFGIQPQCNSQKHIDWCRERGIALIDWPSLLRAGPSMTAVLRETLSGLGLLNTPAFISLDIDVFHHGMAPGCSQSWGTGLSGNDFYLLLDWLKQNLEIRHFGIYEVSPPLDVGLSTSRLAAQILHQLLESPRP